VRISEYGFSHRNVKIQVNWGVKSHNSEYNGISWLQLCGSPKRPSLNFTVQPPLGEYQCCDFGFWGKRTRLRRSMSTRCCSCSLSFRPKSLGLSTRNFEITINLPINTEYIRYNIYVSASIQYTECPKEGKAEKEWSHDLRHPVFTPGTNLRIASNRKIPNWSRDISNVTLLGM